MKVKKEKINSSDTATPSVYKAVRAVGTLRPKFNPNAGRAFSDELNVVGTAFWLKDYKVLVTCAHVVQSLLSAPLELAGLLVVGNAGNYKRAIVEIIDTQHDLAILRLLNNQNGILFGEELDNEAKDGLTITDKYPSVSTLVSYAGFPLGNQLLDQVHSPTYSEGVVGIQKREDSQKKQIQISGSVMGGFSGSPVVIKDSNEVAGIVSNGPTIGGQPTSSIFMAISWEHIKVLAELSTS